MAAQLLLDGQCTVKEIRPGMEGTTASCDGRRLVHVQWNSALKTENAVFTGNEAAYGGAFSLYASEAAIDGMSRATGPLRAAVLQFQRGPGPGPGRYLYKQTKQQGTMLSVFFFLAHRQSDGRQRPASGPLAQPTVRTGSTAGMRTGMRRPSPGDDGTNVYRVRSPLGCPWCRG